MTFSIESESIIDENRRSNDHPNKLLMRSRAQKTLLLFVFLVTLPQHTPAMPRRPDADVVITHSCLRRDGRATAAVCPAPPPTHSYYHRRAPQPAYTRSRSAVPASNKCKQSLRKTCAGIGAQIHLHSSPSDSRPSF